ncbi:hypothetical protein AALD74_11660 [Lachnospiraceae bacterium 48-21]
MADSREIEVKERPLCQYWDDEYCEYWDSEKECQNCTVYKRIPLYTKYAIVDNYHNRRITPIAIFSSKDRAEEYLADLIKKARGNNECFDFDIEEIVTD